jgi:tryptophan-rich sensory protein
MSFWKIFDLPIWASIAIPTVLGFLCGSTTRTSVNTWYKDLRKGPLTPPAWVFPVVWGILYPVMGYTAYLVSRQAFHSKNHDLAELAQHGLVLYYIQLIVNFLWSPIFFILKRIDFALAEIIVLDVLIILTTINFYQVERIAGILWFPYVAWALFATYTTYVTMKLNPVQAHGGQENRPLLN